MTLKRHFRNMFQMIWMLGVGTRLPAQHQIFTAFRFNYILFSGYKQLLPYGVDNDQFTSNPSTCLHSMHTDNFTFTLDLVKILT
jgi:hypothetical protein